MSIPCIKIEEIIIENVFSKEKLTIRPHSFEINLYYYTFQTIETHTGAYISHVRKLRPFDKITIRPVVEYDDQ